MVGLQIEGKFCLIGNEKTIQLHSEHSLVARGEITDRHSCIELLSDGRCHPPNGLPIACVEP